MRVLLAFVFFAFALPAVAQDDGPGFFDRLFRSDNSSSDEEQGSLLEQLIEDQLSGAGRVVKVTGFEGALSGAATLESLTVADDEGVWLTLKDAELDWSRAALFQGRIEVAKLTAGEILLPRLPVSEETEAPTPEATGFRLPELPVSIQIDEISASKVDLGAPVLGAAIEVSAFGALTLEGGKGGAKLAIERLDGRGAVELDASYSNETEILALDLTLREDADGFLARLAGLPGRPSVNFRISGTAPVRNYAADIRLATDGADRLEGQIATFTIDDTTGVTTQISGDIAPLFAPEYRPFFGDKIALEVTAFRTEGGAAVLKDLSLKARTITLEGEATLEPDLMPRRFNLTGEIAEASGAPVLLPLSGVETRVDRVILELAFDSRDGEGWGGRFDIDGFERGSVSARSSSLRVLGQIMPGNVNRVTADVAYRINELDLGDPALKAAVGADISGQAFVDWEGGRDLRLSKVTLEGAALGLSGDAVIATASGFEIDGQAALRSDRLGDFSGLAGRQIGGAANLDLGFALEPLQGTFDISAKGTGTDISVGDPRANEILVGPSRLDVRMTRDESGLGILVNSVETEQARLSGRAALNTGNSTFSLAGDLADAGLILQGLHGPVDLDITGREDADRNWDVTADLGGEAFSAQTNASLIDLYGTPRAEGAFQAQVSDLAALSQLAGRSLRGEVAVDATGSIAFDLSAFSVDGNLKGRELSAGMAEMDRLLGGDTSLVLVASGVDGRTSVSRFLLETGALSASATGSLKPGDSSLDIAARLFDVSPFLDGLSGSAEVSGSVDDLGNGSLGIDLFGSGPGGLRANVAGTMAEDFSAANLAIEGNALLALANTFIAPNTLGGTAAFDLRLNGPFDLSSLSGQVSTRDARLVVPDAKFALSAISLDSNLGRGSVGVDLTGTVEGGGQVAISGPVGMQAPFPADLSVLLTNVFLSDPSLFETRLRGTLGVNGPLEDGARISGALSLGPTEVRIPSSGLGGAGAIPEITHINEPPPVRGTRRRAGLLESNAKGRGTGGPSYPLDVTITAENQLFVRGRRLDSEFGGALRLGGTTQNVVPSGGFNLIRGRLDILGQRLLLDNAQITMEGTFVPRLFLIATTDVQDTSVSVSVTGPADNPEIAFTSSPELPQEEVLARLIFGRGLENLSALQAARLALAVRTLAGRGGEGIVSKLRESTGLADLDVTTTENGDTAVRAGAYLNENLYTDVTVDSAGETQLNLNLDVTPSLTVKGGVSSEGDTSIGIFFERDY